MQNASIENMILVIISNILNVDSCSLEQLTFCQVIAGTGDTVVIVPAGNAETWIEDNAPAFVLYYR